MNTPLKRFRHRLATVLTTIGCLMTAGPASAATAEPGLLFHLSGEQGTTADIAAPGTATPNFDTEVNRIADGAKGAALRCGDVQRLSWWAPGNIYAQRGTLSFFWRSRYPVGPTEFPLFRVGYGDHSSWDMVWLRIDYNGRGFDAFVTDVNLARTRVSVQLDSFPKPDEWTHLALAWDETRGVRFYVNGKLGAKNDTTACYDAALDQFGPHSRVISPYQVQSDYNFTRGGDIDEIRIYDRMLDDAVVATLAKGDAPAVSVVVRTLADPATRTAWWRRYGWDRPGDPPPALPAGQFVSVRKVEIHDAYDLKRWWWKATDGIRETTWPGVFNRSRLPGRSDYFQLPDWDCYVRSGRAITFALPAEPCNHVEIVGSAWGKMELLKPGSALEGAADAPAERALFERPKGAAKTVHRLASPLTGRQVRFTNREAEEPVGELAAYNVTAGHAPAGATALAFRLAAVTPADSGLGPLARFIAGRFASAERALLVAQPANAQSLAVSAAAVSNGLPLVHVLIPNTWDKLDDGLDGIALDLPALKVKPTHGGLFPLNIQVKDPLWPMRNMLDFTFSVKPGEAKTLWLDLRDRLLPVGKGLWLTVAGAGSDFGRAALEGVELRLVFKPRAAARAEHVSDRFTQARDAYAMLVEEHPRTEKFNLWNRFKGDLEDLLRVNPDHPLGRQYAAAGLGAPRPPFAQPAAPAGVPLWAFRQVELLGRVQRFAEWYVDHRQDRYGDFGGGISDDTDFTNLWPGIALMGCAPDKLRDSLRALLEAAYRNGMFANGLSAIQTDELHSYEEGINCLAQTLLLDPSSPRLLERAMETARGVEGITGVNAAGHRHIRSSYFSGTRMATEEPWGRAKPYSYLVLHPGQLLVDFNGSPAARRYLLELADGLLAHRKTTEGGRATLPSAIRFVDDQEMTATRNMLPWHVFWGAWRWTGDRRYLAPINDGGLTQLTAVNANVLDQLDLRADWRRRLGVGERVEPNESRRTDGRGQSPAAGFRGSSMEHFLWQLDGDKRRLENLYAAHIETCALMEFINTEGSLWIDRVGVPTAELQRARLGGVALLRNALYPGHTVSWRFAAPATARSVAVLIPDATRTAFKVIAHNLETAPVRATMTGWNVDPGVWEITQGVDTNGDDTADQTMATTTAAFERSGSLEFTFTPRATTILTLKLKAPGTPYWSRPDLGIDREDVTVAGGTVRVMVHSLGAEAAPASRLVVRDAGGRVLAATAVPVLEAPDDMKPRTTEVTLPVPPGAKLDGATVEIDPDRKLTEITRMNNTVRL